MKVKAHAKINWALDITGIRPDHYHQMDMIMQKIDLHDELSFEPSDTLSLTIEGNSVLAQEDDNLILKAARILRADRALGVHIHLKKRIPTGAGLGGGSADAAATLQALNDLWSLHLDQEELGRIGLSLGADIPYCLTASPARVGGIGEVIDPFLCSRNYELILLQPESCLSTKEIFRIYDSLAPSHPDISAVRKALEYDNRTLLNKSAGNVLTAPSLSLLPVIEDYILELYKSGSFFAGMTGSGSVVFGAFTSSEAADTAYLALKDTHPVCIRTKTI